MHRQYPDHVEMQESGKTHRRFHAVALPAFHPVRNRDHAASSGVFSRFVEYADQPVAQQFQPGVHAEKIDRRRDDDRVGRFDLRQKTLEIIVNHTFFAGAKTGITSATRFDRQLVQS